MCRGDRQVPKLRDPRPAVEILALPERWDLAIQFPKLDGYRVELPDETLHPDFDEDSRWHIDEVHFITRKVVMDRRPVKSHLNHVVLDGLHGNSRKEGLAQACDGCASTV